MQWKIKWIQVAKRVIKADIEVEWTEINGIQWT